MNKFALTTVAGIPSNGASAFVKPEVVTEQRPSHGPTRITSKGYENGKWLVEAREDWKPAEREPWVAMEFNGPDLTERAYAGLTDAEMKFAERSKPVEYSHASREADLAAVKAAFERGEEIEWLSIDGQWKTASKANNKIGFVMGPENYRLADPYRHLKEAWKEGKTIQFSYGGMWHSILNGKEPDWCFGPECYRVLPTLEESLRAEAEPLWVAKDGRAIPVSKMETSHLINAYNYVKKVPGKNRIQGLRAETWRKMFDYELDKRHMETRPS